MPKIENTLAVVADYAYADPSGKLFILGEFRYVLARSLPTVHPRLAMVARWEAPFVEVRDKPMTLIAEIVDADGKAVVEPSPPIPVFFQRTGPADITKASASVILMLENIVLPHAGDYAVDFRLDGVSVGHAAFHVIYQPAK